LNILIGYREMRRDGMAKAFLVLASLSISFRGMYGYGGGYGRLTFRCMKHSGMMLRMERIPLSTSLQYNNNREHECQHSEKPVAYATQETCKIQGLTHAAPPPPSNTSYQLRVLHMYHHDLHQTSAADSTALTACPLCIRNLYRHFLNRHPFRGRFVVVVRWSRSLRWHQHLTPWTSAAPGEHTGGGA
jgi:hypothetical protein